MRVVACGLELHLTRDSRFVHLVELDRDRVAVAAAGGHGACQREDHPEPRHESIVTLPYEPLHEVADATLPPVARRRHVVERPG
jgi:hypothetical protein